MEKTDILILGAGPAGLALSIFLKDRGVSSLVIEKSDRAGGLARSIRIGPYTFDHSGHLLHTQDKRVLDLVRRRLKVPLENIRRKSVCYIWDRFIPFPYQKHLFYAPAEKIREAILGYRPIRIIRHFKDWLEAQYGAGVGRQFLFPYNRKVWNVDLTSMDIDWVPRFLPGGGFREILDSSFSPKQDEWGYNVSFYYPKSGGIGRIGDGLAKRVAERTCLNTFVTGIDLGRHEARLSGGDMVQYRHLVSTMPLPDFLKLCNMPVPKEIVRTGVAVFNLGIKFPVPHRFHWCYVPDPKIPFYRTGIYSNISRSAAPRGHSALYIECAAPPHKLKRFELSDLIPAMKRMGFIRRANDIDVVNRINLANAYPVPLKNLGRRRSQIKRRLAGHHVTLLGRFGAWEYTAISDVIGQAHDLAGVLTRKHNRRP